MESLSEEAMLRPGRLQGQSGGDPLRRPGSTMVRSGRGTCRYHAAQRSRGCGPIEPVLDSVPNGWRCVILIDDMLAAFPSPHGTVLRINDIVRVTKAALQQNMSGGIRHRQRVSPNQPDVTRPKGEAHQRSRSLGRVPSALEGRNDAVGDLDHSAGIRGALESRASDYQTPFTLDDEKPMAPRIWTRSNSE